MELCTVADIETATPRAVGLAQVAFAPSEIVHVYIEPSRTNDEFVGTVKSILETKFFPHVNLDFRFTDSLQPAPEGGIVHITDDRSYGLRAGASGTCKRIGKKNPLIIIGTLSQRVVIHEAAHSVGMIHEQSHPEKTVTFERETLVSFYMERRGLTRRDAEVFVDKNFLSRSSMLSRLRWNEFDVQSVMLYRMPKETNVEGVELVGNTELSDGDKDWLRTAYPLASDDRSLDGPACPACPTCPVQQCPACPLDTVSNMFWTVCVVVFAIACAVIASILFAK